MHGGRRLSLAMVGSETSLKEAKSAISGAVTARAIASNGGVRTCIGSYASTQPEPRRSMRYRAKHAERLDTGHLSDPQRRVPGSRSALLASSRTTAGPERINGRIYTERTDPLTREAAGLIGKALWPDAGKLQPQLQPEAGI
jgi:hypothetical protein